jgi:hypothetical protein
VPDEYSTQYGEVVDVQIVDAETGARKPVELKANSKVKVEIIVQRSDGERNYLLGDVTIEDTGDVQWHVEQ